jgi:hypothetical protein
VGVLVVVVVVVVVVPLLLVVVVVVGVGVVPTTLCGQLMLLLCQEGRQGWPQGVQG